MVENTLVRTKEGVLLGQIRIWFKNNNKNKGPTGCWRFEKKIVRGCCRNCLKCRLVVSVLVSVMAIVVDGVRRAVRDRQKKSIRMWCVVGLGCWCPSLLLMVSVRVGLCWCR